MLLARCRFLLRSRAVVLLYHRVAEQEADPQLLAVKPVNFASHLEAISRDYRPISLRDLRVALRNGRVPHRSVVVTFDDGYEDNVTHAKPLLERYGVPATVFVSSGYMRRPREFWWDELQSLFLSAMKPTESLSVCVNGQQSTWDLADSEPDYAENLREWSVLATHDPTPAHAAYRDLCRMLKPLPPIEREHVMESIRKQIGSGSTRVTGGTPMTHEQLRQLGESRSIEIGGHTVNHVCLSALDSGRQVDEIEDDKRQLEKATGLEIESFSYPFGQVNDYSEESVDIVKDAGFSCACANVMGAVTSETDLYAIPRFVVRDWDEVSFSRKLCEWFRTS